MHVAIAPASPGVMADLKIGKKMLLNLKFLILPGLSFDARYFLEIFRWLKQMNIR